MIKRDKKIFLLLPVIALVVVAGYWGWYKFRAPILAPDPEKPSVHTASDQLRFPANAPQLSFLKIPQNTASLQSYDNPRWRVMVERLCFPMILSFLLSVRGLLKC